jgi:putative peptidoglycan lipid II flippase
VGLFTLVSRILGLVRDAVVAAFYRKRATDAFFVAFRIPNILRRLSGEGSLTVAFIPVFTQCLEQQGEDEARRMLRSTLGLMLLALCPLALVGVGLAPWVVRAFAYGFVGDVDKLDLAVLLTRIMFAFLVTTGLTSLSMGVLNTLRHFASPALAPVVLNVAIISAVVGGTSLVAGWGLAGVVACSIGVVLGGAAQVMLQWPALATRRMLVGPRLDWRHAGVRRVGRLMLPAVFGLAIYEINVIIGGQFASFLPEGSISYLYYAQRLIEFPMGVFVIALATVAMPNLSSHASAGDMDGLKETYRYALRMAFFVILPATAGLIALGLPLTSVLFQRGQFDHPMAARTAVTLFGFLAGLWAGAGVRQTVPVFYALQDTRTPVRAAAVSLVVYVVAAALMYRRLETLGLALAVACSSVVNFGWLVAVLRRRLGRLGLRAISTSTVRAGLAAGACGVVARLVATLGVWELGGAAARNYAVLLAAVAAGVATYALVAWVLRTPELPELVAAFRRRGSGGSDERTDGREEQEQGDLPR